MVSEDFEKWVEYEVDKLEAIRIALKKRFGNVDRDYERMLFDDGKEPWGFRNRSAQNPGNGNGHANGNGRKMENEPATGRQLETVKKYMHGEIGKKVAVKLNEFGVSVDDLSKKQAHGLIDFIFTELDGRRSSK